MHLPIGLLVGAWVASVARLVAPSDRWHDVITAALVAGLATAAGSATTGVAELVRLGSSLAGTAADRLVLVHLSAVTAGGSLFALSLLAHLAGRVWISAGLATAGVALLGFGAHQGGHLVYRHGIGTEFESSAGS